ncbi:Peroxidase 15 [Dichanthelium oligosanthes]|uniref:Peroxidase n=1 Tax=Dichanthelium oligosanthes TaxID=888268 RepID=A0A1E5W9T3_9POAL|nr:Peroxidase 15 [Dichanthelium oligosanthes]
MAPPRGSMSCTSPRLVVVVVLLAAAAALGFGVRGGAAQLCDDYYDQTCPGVHRIVRRVVKKAHEVDARIYASLTRLHFHDCFVQGCDGSILLDNSSSIVSEKFAVPNNNSARGYPVVDDVKAALEEACPGVVSCADILALAAKISVELSGGPRWRVLFGRRDGTTANITAANNLPSPFDNLTTLQQKFGAVGLDDTDLVALSGEIKRPRLLINRCLVVILHEQRSMRDRSWLFNSLRDAGAHTFGRVQCQFVTARLYNFSGTNRPDPTLDRGYRAFLSLRCPRGGDGTALNDLDPTTPDTFDNNYYTNIEARRGTLQSDQELLSTPGAPTAAIVGRFAGSQKEFFKSFARSMINMGNIQVLTGSQGDVRKNCRVVNGG